MPPIELHGYHNYLDPASPLGRLQKSGDRLAFALAQRHPPPAAEQV